MTIKEVKRDLFTMPIDYSLAHCISADFALGAGIAKKFDDKFHCRDRLFRAFPKSWIPRWDNTQERYRGGCVPLILDNSIPTVIFNLVTKRNYWDKPTLKSIENALNWMVEQCRIYDIKKIAMPKIGCGLDKKKWSDVKPLIEKVFADTDIEIIVCYI